MHYPIAIEPGTDKAAFGVVVSDLPGCYSAGDTLGKALAAAEEAAVARVGAARDTGEAIPAPGSFASVRNNKIDKGWLTGALTLDTERTM